MRKKLLTFLATATCLVACALGISACSEEEITFNVDGNAVAKEQTIELGALFMPPDVSAAKGDASFDVSVSITDADGEEVKLINNKFKANDARGYTLTYTATNGSESKTLTVTLKVKDTTAPSFSIKGTSGSVALRGTEVEIPACLVSDVSSDSLTATYTVKDPTGTAVSVTDGKFTAAIAGEYVITYTATDAAGNVGTKDFIVASKNAVMLNDFEEEGDIGFCQFANTKELTTDNAISGNAVKVTVNSDGPGWSRICVPFQKADGSYYTWTELQEFEGIQVSVWSSGANELDLAAQSGFYIESGKNTMYYSMSEIKSNYAQTATQYEENGNGFFLNLRTPTEGLVLIFDQMIGIYADDYIPKTLNFDIVGANGLYVGVNEEVTLPACIATDKNTFETFTATATVQDATGAEVPVTDGKFTPTALGEYTVTYSAVDGNGNIQTQAITFIAKNVEMLNDFNSTDSIGWISFTNEKTANAQHAVSGGGVSVKSVETDASKVNWARICVPFQKADESFYTWEELQEFEGIQVFVYSNVGTELDLAAKAGYSIAPGYNVVYYTLEDIATSLQQSASQYTPDVNGFYVNLRSAAEGNTVIFDRIVGVYADDYAPQIKFKDEEGNALGTELLANLNAEVTIPTVTAIRKGQAAATVTVKVYDTDNVEVPVTDGKFTASNGNGYKIVYTAVDAVGDASLTLNVSVNTRVGKTLTDFKELTDVYYIGGTWSNKTLDENGVKVNSTGTGAWTRICLTFTDEEGTTLTWEQIQEFEEIQIVVYASYAGKVGLLNDDLEQFLDFVEGRNVLTFTKEHILSSYTKNSNQYDASGFSLNLKGIEAGQYITFASVTGYYPEA